MSQIYTLTQSNFVETVAKNTYTLIDFFAEWCPPCKAMKPVFDSLSQDSELTHITFCSLDVDAENSIAAAYKVASIPTFLLVKMTQDETGKQQLVEVRRWVGAQVDALGFKMQILEAAK